MPLAETVTDRALGPIAYLVSRYPLTSHTFIETEVRSLRARGVDVHTFTVRPSPAAEQRSERSRSEAERTKALLDGTPAEWAALAARTLRHRASAVLTGAATAARSGRTLRSRAWQAFYLAEAVRLLDELRTRDIRHVHVHFANNAADIARLVVAMGRHLDGPDAGWRWTLSMHGPTEFESVTAHDLPAKLADADAVACISDFCRAQVMRHSDPEHWAKFHLVRMSVDAEVFADASRERFERPDGPLRVLFVGRLVPEKGPSVLLEALARLSAASPSRPFHLRVVGAGPLAEELAARTAALGLQEQVEFTGALPNEELPEHYRWADVFCLPSFAEGVPVVLMEAMATGLPVLTTSIAGVPELVRDRDTGLLVPAGRPDALADALALLADDRHLRRDLATAARAWVTKEFDPELNSQRLVEALTA